jgi:hypothetical protein
VAVRPPSGSRSTVRCALTSVVVLAIAALAPSPSPAQSCVSGSTFGTPTGTALPSSPIFFPVVADMNRDGKPDVIVSGPNQMRVLLGNGTVAPTPFPTIVPSVNVGSTPRGFAVSDLDGDGFLDVAVAVQVASQLAVLWGDGTGGLPSITGLPTPTQPQSVALGDFDDDGDTDIAIAADDRILIRRKQGGRTYAAATTLSLSAGLQFIVSGDFNLDGKPDLAVTQSTTDSVIVLLGTGGAAFTPAVGSPFTTGAGTGPVALVTADVDRDGILDLVTQSSALNEVIVLRGAGNGAFAAPTAFPVAAASSVLALADFDRDGKLDVVSANPVANVVSLLLGNGTGGFSAPLDFPAGTGPSFPAAGDFDRDGRPDLVVAAPPATQVLVLPNQLGIACPNASFERVGRFRSNPSGNPEAIAVGDLNGDLRLDVVTAGDGTLGVFFGDGKGGVSAPMNLALDFSADSRGVALGDLNADGRLDIVATAPGTNEIQVFLGTGGGAFGPRTDFPMGTGTRALALADLDGDGKLDVVAANEGANTITVRLGNGAGGFLAASTFTAGSGPRAVAVGDFDGDLKRDVVLALGTGNQVVVLRGLGGGSFGAPTTLTTATTPSGVALADLDGDGDLDIAVSNSGGNNVSVVFGNGAGGVSSVALLGMGTTPEAVVAMDLNGDGKIDLATANSGGPSNDVTIRLGTGGGAFGPVSRVEGFEGPRALAFGDFNRDLKLDLAVPNWPITLNGVVIVPGDGKGDFGNGETASGTSDLSNFAVGDLDRDGKLDLVSLDSGAALVRVERGNGDGTFSLSSTQAVAASSDGIVIADFDENGKPDVAIGSVFGANVQVLLGDGLGGLGLPTTFPVGGGASGARVAAVMDFNRDGNVDLVTSNSFSNNVSILPGNGLGGLGAAVNTSVGNSPAGVAVGDFNGDGRADLAVANSNANTVSILLDNGGGGFNVSTLLAGTTPVGITAADLDRNGTLDLAVTDFGSTVVTILVGNGSGGFTPNPPITVGNGPDGIAALDANRDGVLDLAVANRKDNTVAVLLGKAAGGFDPPDSFTVRRRVPRRVVAADFSRDGKPDIAVSELLNAPGAVSVVVNTNCEVRRLDLTTDVSTCHAPASTFPSQPVVRVVDDGDNKIQCDVGPVTASMVPGSGTAGAVLGGTPAQSPSLGTATWNDLSVNLPGRGYQLQFDHPALVATRSRTFSQGLAVTITGPASLCAGQSDVYTAGSGYDIYNWTLDGPSISMAPSVTLTGLSVGPHTLRVDVTQDNCPAFDVRALSVHASLGAVAIATGGPTSFCASCLGGVVTETHGGDGGTLAYQWGFRTASLGPITPIAGKTSPTYGLYGPDFPGPGSYFVVLTITPTCGAATVSNEIPVTVTATGAGDAVPFFTITSKTGQNRLEWVNPASGSYFGTVIRYNVSSPGTSDCAPPTTATSGTGGFFKLGTLGGRDFVDHFSLAPDTTVCYTAFVQQDPGGTVFSAGLPNQGRPFLPGPVKWAFSLGQFSMIPPGNGVDVVHVVGQDGSLHAMVKGDPPGGEGGTWPTTPLFPFVWMPPPRMNGPSQGRPASGPVATPTSTRTIFLSSQDGRVYAFNAETGTLAWASDPLAPPPALQAHPSGVFTAFGGTRDLVFVGTRDPAGSKLYALRLSDGKALSPGWVFDGVSAGFGKIGAISGQAAVDQSARRVYFASRAFDGTNNNTVWCVDLETGAGLWAKAHGDIDTGVSAYNGRLLVGTNPPVPELKSIDTVFPNEGIQAWSFPLPPAEGPVKGYVTVDRLTGELYFSTRDRVWALGPGGAPKWLPSGNRALGSASMPLFAPQDTYVYVGGGDGKLHRLFAADGTEDMAPPFPLSLGDGSAAVGSPTYDVRAGFLYVGTENGVVYAILP